MKNKHYTGCISRNEDSRVVVDRWPKKQPTDRDREAERLAADRQRNRNSVEAQEFGGRDYP